MRTIPRPNAQARVEVHLEFRVKGKARPRFNRSTGSAYMPVDYTINLRDVQWRLRTALFSAPGFMSADALYRVQVIGFRKRRQAKGARQLARLAQECPLGALAPGKPDVDNMLGTVMDAATSLLYADDCQVVHAEVARLWSDEAGAEVVVERLS